MDDSKTHLRDSVPQGEFNALGTLKLGDVTVADIFSHHFGETQPEAEPTFDIHDLSLYADHDLYVAACAECGCAVRYSPEEFDKQRGAV